MGFFGTTVINYKIDHLLGEGGVGILPQFAKSPAAPLGFCDEHKMGTVDSFLNGLVSGPSLMPYRLDDNIDTYGMEIKYGDPCTKAETN